MQSSYQCRPWSFCHSKGCRWVDFEIEKSICLQLLQKINGMRGNGIIDGEASENEFQLKLSLF